MDALEALTSVTLAEVEAQIADVEKQLAAATGALEKRLTALKSLRLFVRKRDGIKGERFGRAPKARPAPAQSADGPVAPSSQPGGSVAARCHTYLTANGPMNPSSLAKAITEEYQSVYGALNKDPTRFKKLDDGTFRAR